jgi:hypothetical protein
MTPTATRDYPPPSVGVLRHARDELGLEWISAGRALHTATNAGDPVALAEAQRLLGPACRRAGVPVTTTAPRR